jgi:hypothetical protein
VSLHIMFFGATFGAREHYLELQPWLSARKRLLAVISS